jgi:protein-L-isoaspartate(D-aspartate) O-methyltransferase
MTDFALARRNMVEGQLRPNRVTNSQLLAVIGALPREKFLPDGLRSVAYSDEDVPAAALPDGAHGAGAPDPDLQPRETDRALVGRPAASGAALLARLVKSVVAIESDTALAAAAERTAKELGLAGVEQKVDRWRRASPPRPYDVILIELRRQVPPAIRAACGWRTDGDHRRRPARRAGRRPALRQRAA